MDGRNRSDVTRGADVSVVLKEDQPTGKQTRGIVQDLLTKSAFHPRGIKVRLQGGKVGRVQVIHSAGRP
ncbi:MAG TPA: YwbE family protein [Terriglobia bacterium]|nr:YwbE family protein [Terriglobia bacterium]